MSFVLARPSRPVVALSQPKAAVAQVPAAPEPAPPAPSSVAPAEAWALACSGQALIIDVRTPEEVRFVGSVPGALNVPWATGTSLTRNPRFVRELEAKVGGDKTRRVLLLCRSGKRSALAVEAAVKAGFSNIASIAEGFEGELDAHGQRGHIDGWRAHGLPWSQD